MSTPESALESENRNAEIFPDCLISEGLRKLIYGIMDSAELPTSVHEYNREIKIAHWRLAGMDLEGNIYAYPVLNGAPQGRTTRVGQIPPDTVIRDERAMKEYSEMKGKANRRAVFPVCFRTLEELIALAAQKEKEMGEIRLKLEECMDMSPQI